MGKVVVIFFWLSLILAGVSTLFYLRIFFSKGEAGIFGRLAVFFSRSCFLALVVTIGAEWLRTGLHPFTGPFSAKVFYAFSILAVYLLFEQVYARRAPKMRVIGALIFPIIVLMLLIGWTQFEAAATLSPELRLFRVFVHVASALLAYGSFIVGTIFAVVYLVQENQLKKKKGMAPTSQKLPSLETAEASTHKALSIGFVFSVILLLTGMFTAQLVWGKMWDWREPRMVSALGMTLVYGFYILSRDVLGWRGRKSSYLALIAFGIAIFTYLSPSLLPSIHRWGIGF